MKMEVDLGRGLVLKNPVMTASGTFGYAEEYAEFVDVNRIGAVVVKGVSLKPREGNPPPRIIETTGGMLNAIGLENVGIDRFIKDKLPFLRKFDTKVIVNIYGESIEEFRLLAQRLNTVDGIHALEVNISCPNVEKGGIAFGAERETASRITQAVRAATDLPVIIKLTPNVTDITEIASAAEDAG
ncbi:MAG: dihydroorotate dehydrogenase, partial [Syntrophales bacterium]